MPHAWSISIASLLFLEATKRMLRRYLLGQTNSALFTILFLVMANKGISSKPQLAH